MILKSLTRKNAGAGKLLKYIFRYVLDEEKLSSKTQQSFIIRHNIRSRTIEGYVKEFKANQENRLFKRKDQAVIHHTILSWSNRDAHHITDPMLKDIVRRYIKLRGENILYVGTKHVDCDHIHLHIAQSAYRLNNRSSRISKAAFARLKIELDAYQRSRYPELTHSLPEHGKASHLLETGKTMAINTFDRSQPQKATLQVCLENAYNSAKSTKDFLLQMEAQGYVPYHRAGKLTGLTAANGRKYRFSKLGYPISLIEELDRHERKQVYALDQLKKLRTRSKQKERMPGGFMPSYRKETRGFGDFPIYGISETAGVSPG